MKKKQTCCKKAWLSVFMFMISVLISACSSDDNTRENETGNAATDKNVSVENADGDSFDEEWYKKNTYSDEDGNTMSFGWLDDGSFEIEFGGVYSAYDLDSAEYTHTKEGYYRYNGDGYCIEYDAENNAVLFVPDSGDAVWHYAD